MGCSRSYLSALPNPAFLMALPLDESRIDASAVIR
jgi:hypothetical protein